MTTTPAPHDTTAAQIGEACLDSIRAILWPGRNG